MKNIIIPILFFSILGVQNCALENKPKKFYDPLTVLGIIGIQKSGPDSKIQTDYLSGTYTITSVPNQGTVGTVFAFTYTGEQEYAISSDVTLDICLNTAKSASTSICEALNVVDTTSKKSITGTVHSYVTSQAQSGSSYYLIIAGSSIYGSGSKQLLTSSKSQIAF